MPMPARPSQLGRRFDERVQEKGLRPRFAAYVIASSWAVGVVVFGVVERLVDPDSFETIWTAMWWAVQTVTTVGYGDVVPGEPAGKVIASFLMIGGLAFYAVVTALVTSIFVSRTQIELRETGEDPLARELEAIGDRLEAMQAQLARLTDARD